MISSTHISVLVLPPECSSGDFGKMTDSMDATRLFVNNVKRIVVKIGTAVVTRESDGRLAVGRLGALCEQLKHLNSQGYEVVLVTSGAVGLGRQRLLYRRLCNSSLSDLQNPQVALSGKACASVGQSCLMALYDAMFSQLDVTSSQLLLTDSDFRDTDFRKQLSETVESLLSLRVIPILNENDAVSTRKAPYQDSSGIFWDNDSLAGLLALELQADLLIMMSDVEGLYTGPPSDPGSKLIHTYRKEKHQQEVTFGDKSRVGRGGMTAKVQAAVTAAESGIPVVITSGYSIDNLINILEGKCIGTLFHQDTLSGNATKQLDAREMAQAARECSRRLQGLSSEERRKILMDIADTLEANEGEIKSANDADIREAKEAGYAESLVSRLSLSPDKIFSLARSIRKLAEMEEPIGRILEKTEIADGLVLDKTSSPLGVLLIIFEARPDALVQIAALGIRTGNGLLMKGGKEATQSNRILHKLITSAIPSAVGDKLIGLVTSRDDIPDLLQLDDVIDLVIPRGSNKLVSEIKKSTKIPVLGHSDGVCHVYVDKSANTDMAKRIVLDAKTDYPAACNAMETLLVHEHLASNGWINELVAELKREGVTVYGGPRASSLLRIKEAHSFHHEYSSMSCTIEIVEDVHAAIEHIHQHGSGHTDCIVTEDEKVAEIFLNQVDSAAVFHNASTRFCDGARFGFGAEVGISTGRIHARGPVGVEGLLTTRWILRGKGQVVNGDKGVAYTHKSLPVQS